MELARDPKQWQDVEGGRVNTTVATLLAVSEALDVSLARLFEDV